MLQLKTNIIRRFFAGLANHDILSFGVFYWLGKEIKKILSVQRMGTSACVAVSREDFWTNPTLSSPEPVQLFPIFRHYLTATGPSRFLAIFRSIYGTQSSFPRRLTFFFCRIWNCHDDATSKQNVVELCQRNVTLYASFSYNVIIFTNTIESLSLVSEHWLGAMLHQQKHRQKFSRYPAVSINCAMQWFPTQFTTVHLLQTYFYWREIIPEKINKYVQRRRVHHCATCAPN